MRHKISVIIDSADSMFHYGVVKKTCIVSGSSSTNVAQGADSAC